MNNLGQRAAARSVSSLVQRLNLSCLGESLRFYPFFRVEPKASRDCIQTKQRSRPERIYVLIGSKRVWLYSRNWDTKVRPYANQ